MHLDPAANIAAAEIADYLEREKSVTLAPIETHEIAVLIDKEIHVERRRVEAIEMELKAAQVKGGDAK